mgnify:CR=1 FL=1|jgi:hypothetical protein
MRQKKPGDSLATPRPTRSDAIILNIALPTTLRAGAYHALHERDGRSVLIYRRDPLRKDAKRRKRSWAIASTAEKLQSVLQPRLWLCSIRWHSASTTLCVVSDGFYLLDVNPDDHVTAVVDRWQIAERRARQMRKEMRQKSLRLNLPPPSVQALERLWDASLGTYHVD